MAKRGGRERVTMGTQGFLRAATGRGLTAELRSEEGVRVGSYGPGKGRPDVVARLLPAQDECELMAVSLAGKLFLSVLCGAG